MLSHSQQVTEEGLEPQVATAAFNLQAIGVTNTDCFLALGCAQPLSTWTWSLATVEKRTQPGRKKGAERGGQRGGHSLPWLISISFSFHMAVCRGKAEVSYRQPILGLQPPRILQSHLQG